MPRNVDAAAAAAAEAAKASAESIRTALSLVLAPLADALSDSANPLPPAQHDRIALARRSASSLLAMVEGVLEGAAAPATDASYAPTDLSAATR